MKNIITTSLLSILLLFVIGCEGFLDENLKSELAPTNTFTSTYGFEVGTAGLYALARSEYNTWGEEGAYMHNNACPYEALQAGTDIVEVINSDNSLLPFGNLTINSENQFVRTYWNWAYGLIASANLILNYSEQNTNWDTSTDKQRFQAEARFFRAYAYRYLVYLYGDIPYVDDIMYDFALNFTRDPKSEVLNNMVEDLKFAAQYLPENPDDANLKEGRLTKWAAYHLMSEVGLMKADYKLAEEAALEVINSGYFALNKTRYGAGKDAPGDAFSDLFIENNQNRKSGNKESIWVMQFEFNAIGGGTNSDDWTRRAWNPKYFDLTGFTVADTLGGRGLAQILPMKWWIGTKGTNAEGDVAGIFDDKDIRNSEYNIKRNWYYNDPSNTSLYGKKCNITEQTWFTTKQLFPALTKFFYGRIENLTLTGSYKDRMKFRLAETYLLLAEAYLGQNDSQKAVDAINEVRRRAGTTLATANQMTMDYLLDERIRELVGEEVRRFTLVRTGKYVERVKTYNNTLKDIVKDYHALWPIPKSIIDSNRDVEFLQNPGYTNN